MLATGKQLRQATSETEGIKVMTTIQFQLDTKATTFCTNGILVFITMHPVNPYSDFRTDVWKKGGNDYFPASISPPGVIKPADNTSIVRPDICQQTDEVKEEDTNGRHDNYQAFINMQNNIAHCRMNKVRDQVVTPVTDEKNVFLNIHVKGTTNESEKVNLETARPHIIFLLENSIGWNSSPCIEISKSVLPDSWIQYVKTNNIQTAGGEEDTSKNVIHDSERIVYCTLESPLKDNTLSKNYIGLLLFSSRIEADRKQGNETFDTPRGIEIIKDKMYIKYDDRQEKMNAKCYKPSASFARKTSSAASNDHNPSKENAKCYMQVHHPSKENTETYMQVRHPSKENAKSYKNRVPPSTSQATSPKHYDVKYDGPPRKSGTSSATVQSYSEYELGMEGHRQDVHISLQDIISQPMEPQNLDITMRPWMGRERIKLYFESQEDRGERMHPQGTSDARIVDDEPSPDENVTPELVTPSSMIRTGIPSRNALRNNSAYHIDDDVNRKEGAANWESIHKYNSGLFSSRQLITRAEPYRATSRQGEDPFTPINQASNDEEADGKPNEDEGDIVKGTGGFSPMPKTTTAFRSRKLTSTSFQTTIVKHAPSSPTKIRQAYNPLLHNAKGCSRQGRTTQPAGEDDRAM